MCDTSYAGVLALLADHLVKLLIIAYNLFNGQVVMANDRALSLFVM